MKTEIYNELRERMVKVVPEIMELKFGCVVEIQAYGNAGYGGVDIINRSRRITARQCRDERLPEYLIGAHYVEHGYLQTDFHRIAGKRDIAAFRLLRILGRDIQLADVLRAMQEVELPEDEFFAAYPYRDTKQKGFWLCHKKEADFDMNRDEYVISSKQWNLTLPLHEQSDELGEWLMAVIEPKDV